MKMIVTKMELQAMIKVMEQSGIIIDGIRDIGAVKTVTQIALSYVTEQTLIETKGMKVSIKNGDYIVEMDEEYTSDIFNFYARVIEKFSKKIICLGKAIIDFQEVNTDEITKDFENTIIKKWIPGEFTS